MSGTNKDYSELPDDRLAGALICMTGYAVGGLLTAYYPDGIDILSFGLNNPLHAVEVLAKQIGEPVQLMIASTDFGNVSRIYIPNNFTAETVSAVAFLKRLGTSIPEQGLWTRLYSRNEGRLLSSAEFERDMTFSGAPNEAPVYLMDIPFGTESRELKARMLDLYKKTGREIMCDFNDDLFRASELAGKAVGPLRPDELTNYRAICESFRYAPPAYIRRLERLEGALPT